MTCIFLVTLPAVELDRDPLMPNSKAICWYDATMSHFTHDLALARRKRGKSLTWVSTKSSSPLGDSLPDAHGHRVSNVWSAPLR